MEESTIKSIVVHKVNRYFPKRFIVVILGFLGITMNYVVRGIMSVAMVAMTNDQNSSGHDTFSSLECPVDAIDAPNGTESKVFIVERFNWDPITRSTIMTAYFYSYFVTVITGGYLAERYGATRLLGGGIFLASLLCFCIPAAARFGSSPLIVVRSVQGLCGGVALPSMSAVVSRWSPKLERSVIMTTIFSGSTMSSVIANPISGYLTTIDFLGGWPAIFYISGLCGCLWWVLWFGLVYETPGVHPSITDEELMYFPDESRNIPSKKREVPWKRILTSLPFWAYFGAQCGVVFTFNIMLVELPTYLTTVLHFNIKASGLLSALPFVVECVSAWTSSFAADRMRASGRWTITTIRKFYQGVSGYVLCLCLLGITYSGCNSFLIMCLLTFGMFLDGLKYSGFHPNTVDMSPDFAGTLYGLSYGASSIFGISGPQLVGIFTASGATINNWSKVFYVTAAIKFVSTTFYVAFASAEQQPWGKAPSIDKKNVETKL